MKTLISRIEDMRGKRVYAIILNNAILIISIVIAFTRTNGFAHFVFIYAVLSGVTNLAKHVVIDLIFIVFLILSLFQII